MFMIRFELFKKHVIKFVEQWLKDWNLNSKRIKCFADIDTYKKTKEKLARKERWDPKRKHDEVEYTWYLSHSMTLSWMMTNSMHMQWNAPNYKY